MERQGETHLFLVFSPDTWRGWMHEHYLGRLQDASLLFSNIQTFIILLQGTSSRVGEGQSLTILQGFVDKVVWVGKHVCGWG
jgi:hypothetical protein